MSDFDHGTPSETTGYSRVISLGGVPSSFPNNHTNQIQPYNQSSDLTSRISNTLHAQNDTLRRKKQDLDQLKDSLTELEEFTQTVHRKLTLHTKMKDELTTKSYDHHPLHQNHQDLLKEIEGKCQELIKMITQMEGNDPNVCTSLMAENSTSKLLTTLSEQLEDIVQHQVNNVVDHYNDVNEQLAARIDILQRFTLPNIRNALTLANETTSPHIKLQYDQFDRDLSQIQQQLEDVARNNSEKSTQVEGYLKDIATQSDEVKQLNTKMGKLNQFKELNASFYSRITDLGGSIVEKNCQLEFINDEIKTIQDKISVCETETIRQLQIDVENTNVNLNGYELKVSELENNIATLKSNTILTQINQYGCDFHNTVSISALNEELSHGINQQLDENNTLHHKMTRKALQINYQQQERDFALSVAKDKFDSLVNKEIELVSMVGNTPTDLTSQLNAFLHDLTPTILATFPVLKSHCADKITSYNKALQDSINKGLSQVDTIHADIENGKKYQHNLETQINLSKSKRAENSNTINTLREQIAIEKARIIAEQQKVSENELIAKQLADEVSQFEHETQQLIQQLNTETDAYRNELQQLVSSLRQQRDDIIIPPPQVELESVDVDNEIEVEDDTVLKSDKVKVVSLVTTDSSSTTTTTTRTTTKKKSTISFNDVPHFKSPSQENTDTDEDGGEILIQNTLHNRHISQLYAEFQHDDASSDASSTNSSAFNTPAIIPTSPDLGSLKNEIHDLGQIKLPNAHISMTNDDDDDNKISSPQDSVDESPNDNRLQVPKAPKQSKKDDVNLLGGVTIEIMNDNEDLDGNLISDKVNLDNKSNKQEELFTTPPRANKTKRKVLPQSPKPTATKTKTTTGSSNNDENTTKRKYTMGDDDDDDHDDNGLGADNINQDNDILDDNVADYISEDDYEDELIGIHHSKPRKVRNYDDDTIMPLPRRRKSKFYDADARLTELLPPSDESDHAALTKVLSQNQSAANIIGLASPSHQPPQSDNTTFNQFVSSGDCRDQSTTPSQQRRTPQQLQDSRRQQVQSLLTSQLHTPGGSRLGKTFNSISTGTGLHHMETLLMTQATRQQTNSVFGMSAAQRKVGTLGTLPQQRVGTNLQSLQKHPQTTIGSIRSKSIHNKSRHHSTNSDSDDGPIQKSHVDRKNHTKSKLSMRNDTDDDDDDDDNNTSLDNSGLYSDDNHNNHNTTTDDDYHTPKTGRKTKDKQSSRRVNHAKPEEAKGQSSKQHDKRNRGKKDEREREVEEYNQKRATEKQRLLERNAALQKEREFDLEQREQAQAKAKLEEKEHKRIQRENRKARQKQQEEEDARRRQEEENHRLQEEESKRLERSRLEKEQLRLEKQQRREERQRQEEILQQQQREKEAREEKRRLKQQARDDKLALELQKQLEVEKSQVQHSLLRQNHPNNAQNLGKNAAHTIRQSVQQTTTHSRHQTMFSSQQNRAVLPQMGMNTQGSLHNNSTMNVSYQNHLVSQQYLQKNPPQHQQQSDNDENINVNFSQSQQPSSNSTNTPNRATTQQTLPSQHIKQPIQTQSILKKPPQVGRNIGVGLLQPVNRPTATGRSLIGNNMAFGMANTRQSNAFGPSKLNTFNARRPNQ